MSANATTGTQTMLRIATTTPTLSAPSQLSQPKANSRFCSRVRARRPGKKLRQCFGNLEATECPTVALLLVGLEGVGQQAIAVAAIGVMGCQPCSIIVSPRSVSSTDGVARPAAALFERGAADQAHGAVHDDGIDFVALDHADLEEAGIFAVHAHASSERAPSR